MEIALDLDALYGPSFRRLSVSAPEFNQIARMLAALDLPTVVVQEIGYLCDELGDNLQAFLGGLAATPT